VGSAAGVLALPGGACHGHAGNTWRRQRGARGHRPGGPGVSAPRAVGGSRRLGREVEKVHSQKKKRVEKVRDDAAEPGLGHKNCSPSNQSGAVNAAELLAFGSLAHVRPG
jgi:hypothetical protein